MGTNLVWSAVAPMGMNMGTGADAGVMDSNTTKKFSGWVVRSEFPDTKIVDDGLVANGAASVTINWKVTLADPWGSSTDLQLKIMKNGTIQLGSAVLIRWQQTTATFPGISTSLVSGDRLELYYTTPFATSRTALAGATNTFLYYTIP
ncbi:hypothetical protein [Nocardia sp. NPDC051570]|uniref:hypothetical protein n=1 Tax=Nocardia sp. NPDC051570 TaxID=3364324 RepID=UPI003794E60E